ncbi:SpoIID/LytB domain-containing protein [Bacteriovorax sp. Seq25_V]|uniref:SpoIID/LytB domain-containing protein n=1 Tax=Bacteriovorax sp. Seq25_V TaxID=1201288 RepID=UPI00038A41E5|nr:SpoIID/LytB domain-containing protein [Bacteriovorax sp. Seq25_V]EQC47374.1 stage II sporulation protein [Bacteriovorax sp. Seq25_V]
MILKFHIALFASTLAFANIKNYQNISNDFKVRVRIAKELNSVTISGTDLKRELYPVKQKKVFAGRKKIKFNCSDFKSDNKMAKNSMLLASLESSTGLISFGKNKYHGKLNVVTSENNDSCDVVNELDMDIYIGSLLAKEMNASWPLEALKAQAVAARTYALYQISKAKLVDDSFFDLENSEKHQVNGDFFDVTQRTLKASRETSGLILTNDLGEVIPAFFHASCGGHTIEPQEVWTNKVSGYKSATCEYCKTRDNWDNTITRERFRAFLDWLGKKDYIRPVGNYKNLVVYPSNKNSGHVELSIGQRRISLRKSLFRRYFGRVIFPSNNFHIVDGQTDGEITFVGKGNGHGVGLCQVGAKSLAQKGLGFREILSHYFPSLKLTKTI